MAVGSVQSLVWVLHRKKRLSFDFVSYPDIISTFPIMENFYDGLTISKLLLAEYSSSNSLSSSKSVSNISVACDKGLATLSGARNDCVLLDRSNISPPPSNGVAGAVLACIRTTDSWVCQVGPDSPKISVVLQQQCCRSRPCLLL